MDTGQADVVLDPPEYDSEANFALIHAGLKPLVTQLTAQNRTPAKLTARLSVRVTGISAEWVHRASLPPNGCHRAKWIVPPHFHVEELLVYDSRSAYLEANCEGHDGVISDIRFQPLAQWPGAEVAKEAERALAAFVLPGNPVVAGLVAEAEQDLRPTGHYLEQLPPKEAVQRIYETCQRRRWSYFRDPWDSRPPGQLVRFPERMNYDGGGNCLELSLFLAACCESRRLRPVLIILQTGTAGGMQHALLGIWQSPVLKGFKGPVLKDSHTLRELVRSGDLLAVEATGFARQGFDFAKSLSEGERQIHRYPLVFALDLLLARRPQGMRPGVGPLLTTDWGVPPAPVNTRSHLRVPFGVLRKTARAGREIWAAVKVGLDLKEIATQYNLDLEEVRRLFDETDEKIRREVGARRRRGGGA